MSDNYLVIHIADQERIRIMKEMHDKGVAHWGIKPDKIHLPRSGKLRLDLELAHPLDHSPKEPIEGDSGTPAFITGENVSSTFSCHTKRLIMDA